MNFMCISDCAARIEADLIQKINKASDFNESRTYLKKKLLRYRFKKPDWIHYVDRSVSWISGQYAFGLCTAASPRATRALTKYYRHLRTVKALGLPVFEVPDQVIHAEVMLHLDERHGCTLFHSLIEQAADLLKSIAARNNGLVVYWPPDQELLVDTLGMITGFCYHYADICGDAALAEIADRQIRYTEQFCIDPESGFPFHAYNPSTGHTSGASCWGRGIGWYLLGLSAYVRRHPEAAPRLLQVFQAVFRTQDSSGYLYDNLAAPSHIDSSATCMAALSLAEALESSLFAPQDEALLVPFLIRSLRALCSSTTEDGKVLDCSGECRAPGQYSTEYGNFFSQGYTLALLKLIQSSEKLQQIICSCKEEEL